MLHLLDPCNCLKFMWLCFKLLSKINQMCLIWFSDLKRIKEFIVGNSCFKKVRLFILSLSNLDFLFCYNVKTKLISK